MTLIEMAFGKEQTTRTWETVFRGGAEARAPHPLCEPGSANHGGIAAASPGGDDQQNDDEQHRQAADGEPERVGIPDGVALAGVDVDLHRRGLSLQYRQGRPVSAIAAVASSVPADFNRVRRTRIGPSRAIVGQRDGPRWVITSCKLG